MLRFSTLAFGNSEPMMETPLTSPIRTAPITIAISARQPHPRNHHFFLLPVVVAEAVSVLLPGGAEGGGGGLAGKLGVFVGIPQFGHTVAEVLTSCPHSKHFVKAMVES